jgi:hypothetical protein
MRTIIALVVVIVSVWLAATYPRLMMNPGDLVQGHREIRDKCLSCHKPFWGIETQKCVSCHKLADIGKDSIRKKKMAFHGRLKDQKCTPCHTDHKGLNVKISPSSFNHDLLSQSEKANCNNCHGNPVDKIHNQIQENCSSCHNTEGWKSGAVFNHDMIKGTDKNNCKSCHKTPADNIHKQVSDACNNCHNTTGWKSGASFNHDMIQGADKSNCKACHPLPDASYHRSFKDNCTKCHTTNRWKPSTFDHSRYFLLDEHHNASCTTCHTGNDYVSYTCYGCHEHTQSHITGKHSRHGMNNINNCVACHKSGNEHEGGEHRGSEHEGEHEGDDD